ncbi:MAG: LysE family translocator [bacterium]
MSNAAAFALTSVLIEMTPGPNMAYLALIAATEGRRAGLAAVAGVATGLASMGVAVAFGLGLLITGEPLAYQALRWAGIFYLLYLAWDGWSSAGTGSSEHAPLGSSLTRYFRRGLITNLLNPKAAIFYVTVLPEFLRPGDGLSATVMLTVIYVAVATAVHLTLVLAAGTAQRWLADAGRLLWVSRGLAVALVLVAVWVWAKG